MATQKAVHFNLKMISPIPNSKSQIFKQGFNVISIRFVNQLFWLVQKCGMQNSEMGKPWGEQLKYYKTNFRDLILDSFTICIQSNKHYCFGVLGFSSFLHPLSDLIGWILQNRKRPAKNWLWRPCGMYLDKKNCLVFT